MESVYGYLPVHRKRRKDLELYDRSLQAWNNGDNIRKNYERIRNYVFEDQWGDVIHWRNGEITEREYIQRKGNVPLQNKASVRRVCRRAGNQARCSSEGGACVRRSVRSCPLL